MNVHRSPRNQANRGYVLVLVLVTAAVSVLLYVAASQWTANSVRLNDRNNTFNSTIAAAEAGSETVLAYVERDFFNQSFDPSNLGYYESQVPTNGWAAAYQFSDGAGTVNRTFFQVGPLSLLTNINSQFPGLYGMVYNCRICGNASPVTSPYQMTASVQQDVQLASIPVFQYAIFYAMDLEINPGPAMKITGKVHSNGNLYTAPGAALEYVDNVTAAGSITNARAPGDPSVGSFMAPVFDQQHVSMVSALALPIGTNLSPSGVSAMLQPPPFGESPQSPVGSQRFYNTADLVVTTGPSNVVVQAGNWNGFATVLPDLTNIVSPYSFISTNASFYDAREGKMTMATDVNVGAFNTWLTNAGAALNNSAQARLGRGLNSIYVRDQRTKAGTFTVVRVNNGQQLPAGGLTIATPQPLYVQGNYNAPDLTPGSTNTANTKPAALVGDAITILSQGWSDNNAGNSSSSLSQRLASDTTINAAFLAGIVPTAVSGGVGHYSGGVENFTRFIEDWSSHTFTYNGSMVVMFPSQCATNFWISPGTYYNPPVRQWAFDANFLDFRRLPPLTPQVRQLVRGSWQLLNGGLAAR